MENQNDKQNNLDSSKGHIIQNDSYFIEFRPDIKDKYLSFIYSKGQKILSAVYLITDILKDVEPIKWEVRKLSVNLLGDVHSFTHAGIRDEEDYRKIKSTSNHLISILVVLSNSGVISTRNIKIIIEEIDKIVAHVGSVTKAEHSATDEENEVVEKLKNLLGGNIERPSSFIKDMSFIKDTNVLNKQQSETKSQAPIFKKTNANLFVKIARKNAILNIIKDKQVATLKDIEVAFPDLSNKTVQREIVSLIGEGLIKQEGKKRWAKYTLPGVSN
ncbi:MAG TPA: hypothetical protein PK886_01615 [Candidatus Paceibacterota bacterium]|nr:hypothetical protein [Candidatus Paceibacterota bacterium]